MGKVVPFPRLDGDSRSLVDWAIDIAQDHLRDDWLSPSELRRVRESVAAAWNVWMRSVPGNADEVQRLLYYVLLERVEFEVRIFRHDFSWTIHPLEGQ